MLTVVEVLKGIELPTGCSADLYRGDSKGPTVILWHGKGPQERDVMAPVAHAASRLGVTVFAADWRSDEDDGGRRDLLGSLDFVRTEGARLGVEPDRVVLAGWSLGARAALDIAAHGVGAPWRPHAVVGIAGGYRQPGAVSNQVVVSSIERCTHPPVPVWLVHGERDEIVPVARSRECAAALVSADWPVELAVPDTDHGGVVMTRYVPALGRCEPSGDPEVLAAGAETVRALVLAASLDRTR